MILDLLLDDVTLADGTRAAVACHSGLVHQLGEPAAFTGNAFHKRISGNRGLLIPSLCHSHIHLDKCYILDKSKLEDGSFQEALRVTAAAKASFTEEDLRERGESLIQQSVRLGVTSMRAHVEVDDTVEFNCLNSGLYIARRFKEICDIQICVFAQEPIMGRKNAELLQRACDTHGPSIAAVGSAPYVEPTDELARRNIDVLIDLAIQHKLHLDFHLDYNLDQSREPLIHYVLSQLRSSEWIKQNPGKTVAIGHATRLSLFSTDEWKMLREEIGDLPVTLIGLPQSDVYMMGRSVPSHPRGTLNVTEIARDHGINVALSVNNVANAFTPHGNGDPLALCPLGVALYQTATPDSCRILLEAVTTRSKNAIGQAVCNSSLQIAQGMSADFVLLHGNSSVQSAVLSPSETRTTIKNGEVVGWRSFQEWDALG